jgi:phenylalanine-4-hydroxylase
MMEKLELSQSGIRGMEKLSSRLARLTGWHVVPVLELVPDEIFFDHLANRRFPAGAFIRDGLPQVFGQHFHLYVAHDPSGWIASLCRSMRERIFHQPLMIAHTFLKRT